jgi:putative peptide zinc metalloprotease protein
MLREETATWGERVWFVIYAPAAYVYRIVVMFGIAWFLAQSWFVLGLLLAVWTVFQSVVKPVAKHLRHVVTAPRLRKVRRRAMGLTFGGIAVILAALALIPLPLYTDTEGVVWLPDEAYVRARAPGFVAEVPVARGAEVPANGELAQLVEPTQDARLEAMKWRAEELRRRLTALEVSDRTEAEIARLELAEAEGELASEVGRVADLTLRAPLDGRFEPLMPPGDLVGRYMAEGDILGYVLPDRADRLRIVVRQDDVILVRGTVEAVEVKLAGHLEDRHRATLIREVPSALNTLPSAALGQNGGGRFLIDPSDRDGLRSLDQVFVFDLSLPKTLSPAPYGARVIVRFDHGTEPALQQAWRRVSQLFLELLNA